MKPATPPNARRTTASRRSARAGPACGTGATRDGVVSSPSVRGADANARSARGRRRTRGTMSSASVLAPPLPLLFESCRGISRRGLRVPAPARPPCETGKKNPGAARPIRGSRPRRARSTERIASSAAAPRADARPASERTRDGRTDIAAGVPRRKTPRERDAHGPLERRAYRRSMSGRDLHGAANHTRRVMHVKQDGSRFTRACVRRRDTASPSSPGIPDAHRYPARAFVPVPSSAATARRYREGA